MKRYSFFLAVAVICFGSTLCRAEVADLTAALDSITSSELNKHVSALADDTFEGREAGTRGGRAAGLYIVELLKGYGLPGGVKGGYYQKFGSYANILAVLEGSDPQLKNEYIVVGAHYDHVGYGTRRNSYGPIGYIHNGADDNASGVAALLEVAQAFAMTKTRPKRSILFCFWDGEEKGLFGSKHWLEHPTIPLKQVVLAFNADMVGRLKKKSLEIIGVRTATGLRKLVSLANDDPDLSLNFNWELKENSDHYPFVQKKIPVVMFHTGLHDDYHRPSDDAEKIDVDGIQQTSRFLFRFLDYAADAPQIGGFRNQSQWETPATARQLDRPLPPLPGRLGLVWDQQKAATGQIVATKVVANSAAAKAGLRPGDRILEFAGQPATSTIDFQAAVLAAKNPAEVLVERSGETEPKKLTVELAGIPVRLGISWRKDAAEPNALIVNRVVPGSAADRAGVKVNDRIYRLNESEAVDSETFQNIVGTAEGPIELVLETAGRPRTVTIELPRTR